MKKIAAILLSAIIACSFMVGCGDDDDSSSKKSGKNDSEVSAADESGEDESKEDESKKDDSTEDVSKGDESKDDESSKEDESSKDDGDELNVDKNLIGKWQAKQVNEDDMIYTQEYNGVAVKSIRFEFKDDNTGTYYHGSDSYDITWSMKDGVGYAKTKFEAEPLPLKISGGELVATEGDTSVRLKMVDKFDDLTDESKPDDSSKSEPVGNLDTATYVGKWECSRMVVDGTEIPGSQDMGGITLAKAFTMELKADGTGVMISLVNSSGEADEEPFTWKSIDGGIWLDDTYDEYEFPYDGKEIEFDTGDGVIYLKKVK